jgi:hypothetical protein
MRKIEAHFAWNGKRAGVSLATKQLTALQRLRQVTRLSRADRCAEPSALYS